MDLNKESKAATAPFPVSPGGWWRGGGRGLVSVRRVAELVGRLLVDPDLVAGEAQGQQEGAITCA